MISETAWLSERLRTVLGAPVAWIVVKRNLNGSGRRNSPTFCDIYFQAPCQTNHNTQLERRYTDHVVSHLLTQGEIELGCLFRILVLGLKVNHYAVLEEVVVRHRVGVHPLVLHIGHPTTQVNQTTHLFPNETHSFSGNSTWKQMTSPSWISLCPNVAFIFISSIIPGLISSKNLSGVLAGQRRRSLIMAVRSATFILRWTYILPMP